MNVPPELVRLLSGRPSVDATEQAFPFLTVDERGFPHVALLSRAELDVSRDESKVLVAVYSERTRENLGRTGQAGLITVSGTTAHYAKLRLCQAIEAERLLGCSLEVVEHKADDIGIPLEPIAFRTSQDLSTTEAWDASERVLRMLDGRER